MFFFILPETKATFTVDTIRPLEEYELVDIDEPELKIEFKSTFPKNLMVQVRPVEPDISEEIMTELKGLLATKVSEEGSEREELVSQFLKLSSDEKFKFNFNFGKSEV